MGSAKADRPWVPGLSPSCSIIPPWADWQDKWEQMACLWLRGLPAQPLPPQGLLGLGLRAWPGPEGMSVCAYQAGGEAGGGGSVPGEDLPSCTWEGSPGGFLALPPTLLARIPQGDSPICLAHPTPRATVRLSLQLLSATCLSGTPLTQFLRSYECL